MCQFYSTRLRAIGAGKSALFVAEEFTFYQSARNGWTTDLHERSVPPGRLGMNQLCKHFLSSAALSSEQDCNIGTRSLFQFQADFIHNRGRFQRSRHQAVDLESARGALRLVLPYKSLTCPYETRTDTR